MRVFFCTNRERRVRNCLRKTKWAKKYPHLASPRKGSLTAEAAFVLPVFLFGMLVFLYLLRIYQGREQIQEALAVTARAASQYGVIQGERFYDSLEENGGSFSYIPGGSRGISLSGSGIIPVTEEIWIQAEYKVMLPVPFFDGRGLTICQKTKSRVFSGVSFWGHPSGESREELVYVTENGTVYHRQRSCSYLNPSVSMTWGQEVFNKRNKKGGKYKPCGACMKKKTVSDRSLYITEKGDCYHSTPGCMGLKRTVYEIELSKMGSIHCCSKCGG